MAKLVVHLVHGTWPRGFPPLPWLSRLFRRWSIPPNPLWFEEGSDFRKAVGDPLKAKGEVVFRPFQWSGKNSVLARKKAAGRLKDDMMRIARDEPHSKQAIVAHSHGGNIAVRAVAGLDPSSVGVGVATLATPFLHVQSRALSKQVIFFMVFAFVLTTAVIGVDTALFFSDRKEHLPLWDYPARGSALWFSMIIFLVAFTWQILTFCAYALMERWRRELRNWQSPNLPPGLDLLILRAPGDEASLALGSAGFLALVSWLLWGWLVLPQKVIAKFWKTSEYFGRYAEAGILTKQNNWLIIDCALRFFYLYKIMYYIVYWALIFVCFIMIMILVMSCLSVAVPLLWLGSSIFLMPFGIEFVAAGPRVEVNAESTPEGCWSVESLPTTDTSGTFGRHSIPAHPKAHEHLIAWLGSILMVKAE